MKYFLFPLSIVLALACNNTSQTATPAPQSANDSAIETLLKRSEEKISQNSSFMDSLKSKTKILLMEYYQAGWMDACNKLITLNNANRLNDISVEQARKKYWAKMRAELNSK